MGKTSFSLRDGYIQFGYRLRNKYFRKLVGIKIESKHWNLKTRRIMSGCRDYVEYNRLLDTYQKRMNDLFYDSLSHGYQITEKSINQKVFGIKITSKAVHKDFKGFIDDIILKRDNDPSFKKNTLKVYRSLKYAIIEYEENNGVVRFEDMDERFFNEFGIFLKTVKKTNVNTTGKYMGTFRLMLRLADRMKLPVLNDYKSIKVKSQPGYNVYLTIDELTKLWECDYQSVRLRNAVNLFLIGAFTGLRFGDFHKLSLDNIRKVGTQEMIFIQQAKTGGHPLVIPIHPIVRSILDEGIPYQLSNQRLNLYIKEAARVAKITQSILHYYNEAGKDVSAVYEKCDLVFTHTARRSMITNMVLQGIPNHLVMKISGHKTESAFRRYLCMDNEEAAVLLSNHEFFKAV